MFGSLVSAIILFFSGILQVGISGDSLSCYLPDGQVVQLNRGQCKKLGGTLVPPTPTTTPTPTVTATPSPTSTPAPTPTPAPPVIYRVEQFDGSSGGSGYGWLTGVKAIGYNFVPDDRMKLVSRGVEYAGSYQGNEATWILTDFYALPHCQYFDVIVYGSTGFTTAPASVKTICP